MPDREDDVSVSNAAPSPQGVVGLGLGKAVQAAPAPQGVVGLGLGRAPPQPQGPVGLGLGTPPVAPAIAPVEAKPRRPGIVIGDSAAERMRALLAQRGTPTSLLRIRVKGGGCSGLSYDMEWSETPREKDRVFENGDVKLCIDPKSYIFLVGTTLEYFTTKLESGFKLVNPNVQKSCSCGESFTV